MHEYFKRTFDRLVDGFSSDKRCVGILLHGSGGQGTDDIYSDIDLTVVVRLLISRRLLLQLLEAVQSRRTNPAFSNTNHFLHVVPQGIWRYAGGVPPAMQAK